MAGFREDIEQERLAQRPEGTVQLRAREAEEIPIWLFESKHRRIAEKRSLPWREPREPLENEGARISRTALGLTTRRSGDSLAVVTRFSRMS